MISITRSTGSLIAISCDFYEEGSYIHWYQSKEGKAPQRLLYYDFFYSRPVIDSEFSSKKYHAYAGTDKNYKFVLRNADESDTGIYYCATWTTTVTHICLYLY
jgi:hypothetical protein